MIMFVQTQTQTKAKKGSEPNDHLGSNSKACRNSWLSRLRLITSRSLRKLSSGLNLFWLLTKDDAATFVAPNTAFGMFGALAGSTLMIPSSSPLDVLLRLPLVVFFNWTNLLVFDLANQRLPESALEDALNKPWRPVPRGLMTSVQVRRAMLFFIPLVLVVNHFLLDAGVETALIQILTWLYNDLRGGDDHWILRNVIIAVAFGFFNLGSLRVAHGSLQRGSVTAVGVAWTATISGVILTTMHVQDLKDQEGDQARGRRSAPLALGDQLSRYTIAVPVLFWTLFCAEFWPLGVTLRAGPVVLGALVAVRCLAYSGKTSDRLTWELWALWTATLYSMPCLYYARSIS